MELVVPSSIEIVKFPYCICPSSGNLFVLVLNVPVPQETTLFADALIERFVCNSTDALEDGVGVTAPKPVS